MKKLCIDSERLRSSMAAMSLIGQTQRGGVSRLALTNEDREARDLLVEWMKKARLKVRVDDSGNIYGRLPGTEQGLPPVVIGSHLDSVFNGGKYDGTLGVLAALEAVKRIGEAGVKLRHPVDVVSFTSEEGARFSPAMLGSGVISGSFTKSWVYDRRDPEGLRFGDELRRIGYAGEAVNRLKSVAAFIELHIEQGPQLEEANTHLGIVDGIVCNAWLEVKIEGQADHAGPTPMRTRRDPMVASARMIEAVRSITLRYEGAVGTVGRINASPNIPNVIPGNVQFTVDFRDAAEEVVDRAVQQFTTRATGIAREEDVDASVSEIWRMRPTRFSSRISAALEEVCHSMGYPYLRMISAAGHDSRHMASLGDTMMIFVQTQDGKSHCEEETAPWEAIEQATNVLLNSVMKLAR